MHSTLFRIDHVTINNKSLSRDVQKQFGDMKKREMKRKLNEYFPVLVTVIIDNILAISTQAAFNRF